MIPLLSSVSDSKETVQVVISPSGLSLWDLKITQIMVQSLEARRKRFISTLLEKGWVLLHIYTLTYREDDVWRERPMGVFGLPTSQTHSSK